MEPRPSRWVSIQTRLRTLSVMTRPREEVLAAVTQIREVTATPSLMRLSTTLLLNGRRGRELRLFRPRPPSVHAPTLPPVVPRFAQRQQHQQERQQRKARALSTLCLPLCAPHLSSRMNQLTVAQYRLQFLRYTTQRRVRLTEDLRKPFSLCILPFTCLHLIIFCGLCVYTSYQVSRIPIPLETSVFIALCTSTWGVHHPLIFTTQNRLAIPHHTFTVRCRTIRFICSAYCALSPLLFFWPNLCLRHYTLRSGQPYFWLDSTLCRTRVGITPA